jgi:hypothetical protein
MNMIDAKWRSYRETPLEIGGRDEKFPKEGVKVKI